MSTDIYMILNLVLERIKPSEYDKIRFIEIYNHIKNRLELCLKQILDNKKVTISMQGSVAKDTYLKNQSDIDIFLLFEPNKDITIEWFKETLIPAIISCFSNHKYTLNYASHPYLTLFLNNIEANIVPAFKVESPDKILSAVDRTPFHTEYIKTHLSGPQKDEVRLLKQFLKTWNLYGAEIKVQGFSGYLTELLIMAYGTFYNLLNSAINWRAYKTCIDIEHHYSSSMDCIKRFQGSVLIVVDPVDPKRNVAAALSLKNFSMFKLLAKLFIEKPSIEFFQDDYQENVGIELIKTYIDHRLKSYKSCIYIILFEIVKSVPDIVWGQLNRLKTVVLNSTLVRDINRNLYIDVWTNDELTKAALVIELVQCDKVFQLHRGPYAYDTVNAIKFLAKNASSEVGPWIGDDGRLYTIKRVDNEIIARGIINTISSISLTALKLNKMVIVNSIEDLYSIDNLGSNFIYWLKRFLERKPFKKILDILSSQRFS